MQSSLFRSIKCVFALLLSTAALSVVATPQGALLPNRGQPILLPAWGPAFVDRPTHITVHREDRYVYVSQDTNHTVAEYEVELGRGFFTRTIGVPGGGTGGGQFQFPQQTAIVGNDMFVADQGNNRIQRLSMVNGAYQSDFGTGGSGVGQLSAPTGLVFNPVNNRLYVSELGNDRIQVFELDGTPVSTFGSAGGGDGQLNDPTELAVDSSGNVYVADTNNNRIVAFSPNGSFIRTVVSGVLAPKGVAIDEADLVWTVSSATSEVLAVKTSGEQILSYNPTRLPGFQPYNLRDPRGIAIFNPAYPGATRGRPFVMIVDYDQTHVVGHTLGNAAVDFRVVRTIQTAATDGGQIALDQDESLYIVSPLQNRAFKYDRTGALVASWGSPGNAPGQFSSPSGISVNSSGSVFVSDTLNHRVQEFSSNGTFVRHFGVQGAGLGELDMPLMVSASTFGFWVADSGNGRIQEFSSGTAYSFGSPGSGDGELDHPVALSVDLYSGLTYVSDSGNHRVAAFNGGAFVENFGNGVVGSAPLISPRGIVANGRGSVFVADTGNNRVVQFTAQGDFLSEFPTPPDPEGLAVDADGDIYVSFRNSSEVRVYRGFRPSADGLGVYRPSTKTFLLRRTATSGPPELTFSIPDASTTAAPLIGDWNGDGIDTPALIDGETIYLWDRWHNISLANAVRKLWNQFPYYYGVADWNIDGLSEFTSHENILGQTRFHREIYDFTPEYLYTFGAADGRAIFGDWNADGVITEARYLPTSSTFRITNQLAQDTVTVDATRVLGPPNSRPFAGDWDGSGQDRIAVYDPVSGMFILDTVSGTTQITLGAAAPGVMFGDGFEDYVPPADAQGDIPISGRWPQ